MLYVLGAPDVLMAKAAARTDHPDMNKMLVQRFFDEYLNTGDLDHLDGLVSFDLGQHGERGLPGASRGSRRTWRHGTPPSPIFGSRSWR